MKKHSLKLSLIALAAMGACLAFAQQPVNVTVNGQPVQFSGAPPQQVNGRVLVPLRGVFEQMGATVHWDQATQSIDAAREGTQVHLQIGSNIATINGNETRLDVPPMLIADTTMVPLRFVSEALGAEVNWNNSTETVAIILPEGGGAENEHYGPDYDRQRREQEAERRREHDQQVAEAQRRHDQEVADAQRQHDLAAEQQQQAYQSQQRVERHALRVALSRNEVIPVTLDQPLSSDHNVEGDRFSATLQTNGYDNYGGIPAGTKILGHVSLARPRNGDEPGVLQLAFDQLRLPDGHHVDVDGRLIGLDKESVSTDRNGVLVANPGALQRPNNPTAFIGYGAAGGAAIGLLSNGRVLEDAAIGGALGFLLSQIASHPEHVRNVYLAAGTSMGVRLEKPLRYGGRF